MQHVAPRDQALRGNCVWHCRWFQRLEGLANALLEKNPEKPLTRDLASPVANRLIIQLLYPHPGPRSY